MSSTPTLTVNVLYTCPLSPDDDVIVDGKPAYVRRTDLRDGVVQAQIAMMPGYEHEGRTTFWAPASAFTKTRPTA